MRITEGTKLTRGQYIYHHGTIDRVESSGPKQTTLRRQSQDKVKGIPPTWEGGSTSTHDTSSLVGSLLIPKGLETIAVNIITAHYLNTTFDGVCWGRSGGEGYRREEERLLCAALGHEVPFYGDEDLKGMIKSFKDFLSASSKGGWTALTEGTEVLKTCLYPLLPPHMTLEMGRAYIRKYASKIAHETGIASLGLDETRIYLERKKEEEA